jgi:putative peptide zinc metalloprotease protein
LFGRLSGQLSNEGNSDLLAYKAYALASATFWLLLIGMVVYFSATWLETNMSGTGVFLFLLIFLYFVISFVRNSKSRRAEMNSNIQNRPGMRGRGRFQQRFQDQLEPDIDEESVDEIQKKKPRWLKYLIALVLLVVAFIPYPYETGGAFTVLPAEQEWIYGETKGIVNNVFHNGNEHLPVGELIAKLSSHDQEEAVQVTVAAIAEQRAKLEELLTTPTKEDIEVAKSNLNTAQTHYKYSSESAKRLEALYKDGNVSLDVYQDEEKQMEVDKMQVVEASANLNKVMAGPHPMEIEAAKSELKRLEEKLKFDQSELEMTDLVMPMDGYLVTRNLKQTIGKYLDEGDMFAVVENTSSVRVEIGIPEADISDVKIGAKVRLKLWAYPDIIVEGVVSEIDRNITEDTFGDVIIVTAIIDNQNGLLQSGMTGFGKVDGGSKFVIVAFTRMIVRFFRVELWSWIP